MPLNTISETIVAEANAQAERIHSSAQGRAAQVIETAKADAEALVEEAVYLAISLAKEAQRQNLATEKLRARDAFLIAKQEVLDSVFELAREKLFDIDEASYIRLMAHLISEHAQGREELILDKSDSKRAALIINEANEKLAEVDKESVKLSSESRSISRGFILTLGGVEENFSFDQLLSMAREELEPDIAKIVFEATD